MSKLAALGSKWTLLLDTEVGCEGLAFHTYHTISLVFEKVASCLCISKSLMPILLPCAFYSFHGASYISSSLTVGCCVLMECIGTEWMH